MLAEYQAICMIHCSVNTRCMQRCFSNIMNITRAANVLGLDQGWKHLSSLN